MGSETDKRWKGRKIDWLEIADMDSTIYELKPLNQQQVAVLLMLLDYQKWTTRWENLALSKSELLAYIGQIEYRLMLDYMPPIDCEEIETCLTTSTIINNIEGDVTNIEGDVTTINTSITNINNEVNIIQEQTGAKNFVPPLSDYVDDDLCNASSYTSNQLIADAITVYNQKSSSNIGDWIAGLIVGSSGWDAIKLSPLWNSINAAYSNTVAELNAAYGELQSILYDANLDKDAAKTAVLASGSMSSAAKSALAAMLDAKTVGKIGELAIIGKSKNAGGCIATTSWQWKYATHACTYGMPTGWTINIGAATCGSSAGFNGVFRTRTNVAAEVFITINLPSAIQIDSVRVNALCNLVSGFNDGTLRVTVNNAGVEVFNNAQTLPRTGYTVHNYTPVIVGNQIVIYGVQTYLSQNPTGIAINNLAVNANLL